MLLYDQVSMIHNIDSKMRRVIYASNILKNHTVL